MSKKIIRRFEDFNSKKNIQLSDKKIPYNPFTVVNKFEKTFDTEKLDKIEANDSYQSYSQQVITHDRATTEVNRDNKKETYKLLCKEQSNPVEYSLSPKRTSLDSRAEFLKSVPILNNEDYNYRTNGTRNNNFLDWNYQVGLDEKENYSEQINDIQEQNLSQISKKSKNTKQSNILKNGNLIKGIKGINNILTHKVPDFCDNIYSKNVFMLSKIVNPIIEKPSVFTTNSKNVSANKFEHVVYKTQLNMSSKPYNESMQKIENRMDCYSRSSSQNQSNQLSRRSSLN